jgi:hypothetical protein
VPLNREMVEMFRARPGSQGVDLCRDVHRLHEEGIYFSLLKSRDLDFTFHDQRPRAINNWRLQGRDYFRIMAAIGHKTWSVFKRCNSVSREELRLWQGEIGHETHCYNHQATIKARKPTPP